MRWDVIEEHLDEASFLWMRWERALTAPHYAPRDVASLEERLRARMDALVLGGEPVAERLLRPALEIDEPERVAVAVSCLLSEENDPSLSLLNTGLPPQEKGLTPPWQRALEVCEQPRLSAKLGALHGGCAPDLRRSLVEVLSFRRAPLKEGVVRALWEGGDARAQATALRAAARVPGLLAPGVIVEALKSNHPAVRDAALETGLVLGIREAGAACQALARGHEPRSTMARLLGAMGEKAGGEDWLLEALRRPALQKDALWAAGFSGQPALAEACLSLMEEKTLAPLAGEAFCAITGLVLEGEFVAPRPEEPETLPPLEEEDLDANLIPPPEDALAVPAAGAVSRWWARARPGFALRQRYLRGQPFTVERLVDELEYGPMRRRAALALELAIRSRGEHHVPVRAFIPQQLQVLRHLRAKPLTHRSGPYLTA